MILYKQYNKLPADYIEKKVHEFLEEDIPYGDITTIATVNNAGHESPRAVAYVEAQQNLIFAGEDIIRGFFNDEDIEVELLVKDGDLVKDEEYIAKITGPADRILILERPMLNLLQRLCGIATQTRKFVDLARPHNVHILDTRKTTPGLKLFEKYAVTCGGGVNHRLDLSAGILIKDNHIVAAGGVENAVQLARHHYPHHVVELEVETLEQLEEGLKAKAGGFLLDNMSSQMTKEAVDIIRNSENGDKIFVEASGGMTYENFKPYLETGVNAISVGALTHTIESADIHIEFEEE